ncbi:MAG: replicative DNA helicase [Rhodothalassiaceae bacterium]|nr:MAG: replicative DNA helicase [Rhodothalassiaceae bacterium]
MEDLAVPGAAGEAQDGDPRYRSLPHNLELEQALLGAMLVDNEVAEQVREFLEPRHFFEPVHARIYEAILALIDRDQRADPIKLKPVFDADEALKDLGGGGYLARLAANAALFTDARDYARAIRDLAMKRELIHIGREMVLAAYDADLRRPAEEQLEEAESKLFDLAAKGTADAGAKPFRKAVFQALEAAEAAYRDPDKISGITTGLKALNDKIGGLHRTDLIILAGRPAMGKTALATNIAYAAAKRWLDDMEMGHDLSRSRGCPVAYFSLEMSADQLAARIVADRAGIKTEEMRRGRLTAEQFENLTRAVHELEKLPLYIDDTPALSITALYTRARRMKRLYDIGLVVVDYLQLLHGSRANPESRVQEISEITRGLKALAKKLEVPVLALSQLSRLVEQRDNKRPQLADLRESGTIEQDADIVMFVYREEYYLEQQKPDESSERFEKWLEKMERARGLAEVIIGKQRHGPTGTVPLAFNKETTRFTDRANPEYLPEDH